MIELGPCMLALILYTILVHRFKFANNLQMKLRFCVPPFAGCKFAVSTTIVSPGDVSSKLNCGGAVNFSMGALVRTMLRTALKH